MVRSCRSSCRRQRTNRRGRRYGRNPKKTVSKAKTSWQPSWRQSRTAISWAPAIRITRVPVRWISRQSIGLHRLTRWPLHLRQFCRVTTARSRPKSPWSMTTTTISAKTWCICMAASCIATKHSHSFTLNGITWSAPTNATGVASRNRASILQPRRAILMKPYGLTHACCRRFGRSLNASRAMVCAKSGTCLKGRTWTSTPPSSRSLTFGPG